MLLYLRTSLCNHQSVLAVVFFLSPTAVSGLEKARSRNTRSVKILRVSTGRFYAYFIYGRQVNGEEKELERSKC